MEFCLANIFTYIFVGLIFLVGASYLNVKLVLFQYWKRRGVPSLEPSFPFGNFGPAALKRLSIGEVAQNLYNKSADRFVGVHNNTKPILILRDPELIHGILIKDFAYFVDPISAGLSTSSGIRWKNGHATLSTVFMSDNLPAAFSTILDCGASLQDYVRNAAKNEDVIDVRKIAANFTSDIFEASVFNVNVNSIENPETNFRQYEGNVSKAGLDTSSSTMSFCLFEIAKNQKVQSLIQEEIDVVTAKYNNQITYESFSEMKYSEACIDETLRKYPIVPTLTRECTRDYQIPGTDKIIDKGAKIIIPVLGLHRDPHFYPNPNNFEPERFFVANACDKSFTEMPYLPVGDATRDSFEIRVCKIQTKVGLIMMLQKTSIFLQDNAPRELKINPNENIMTPNDGFINLKVKNRN